MALPVGRTAKSFVGVAVFILVWLTTRPAVADAERSAVDVVATGEPAATSAVEALVRELLNRLPVLIRWADAPHIDPREVLADRTPDPGVVARVWVDLSRPTEARLFVANGASDHFLVRVVPAGDGHIEVEREAVAQIVGFAVEALLTGSDIGVTREAAAKQILADPTRIETPVPVPRRAPEPRPFRAGVSGELGAFVGLRALGPGSAGVEPGLLAGVRGKGAGAVQPVLVLEWQYEAPLDLLGNAIAVRLEGAGGRLHGGILARLGSRVSIQATVGLGADAIHARPYAPAGSAFVARAPFWLGAMVATAGLAVDVVVASPIALFASAGCELDMSGVSFPVTTNGSAEPNVVPWRVWPFALFGVNVSLEGNPSRLP